jgi:hypothetical protein
MRRCGTRHSWELKAVLVTKARYFYGSRKHTPPTWLLCNVWRDNSLVKGSWREMHCVECEWGWVRDNEDGTK